MKNIQSHRKICGSPVHFFRVTTASCLDSGGWQADRRRCRLLWTALVLVLWLPTAGWTQASAGTETEVGVWGGWYEQGRSEDAVELGFDMTLEADALWGIDRWGIRPQFGALVTSDQAVYGFGGFRYTPPIPTDLWRIDMSTSMGLYENGDGKDLGGSLEFRSGLDVMRRLPGGNHVAVSFFHISNAGVYDHNPGSNTLLVRYVFKWAGRSQR